VLAEGGTGRALGGILPDVVDMLATTSECAVAVWSLEEEDPVLLTTAGDDKPMRELANAMAESLTPEARRAVAHDMRILRRTMHIRRGVETAGTGPYADRLIAAGVGEAFALPLTGDTTTPIGFLMICRGAGAPPIPLPDEPPVNGLVHAVRAALVAAAEMRRVQVETQAITDVSDAIVAVDGDLLVSVWNPAAERLSGLSRSAVLGRPIVEVLSCSRLERIDNGGDRRETTMDDVLTDLWRSGRWTGSAEVSLIDGPSAKVEAHVTLVMASDGHLAGAVAVAHDMTTHDTGREEVQRQRLLAQAAVEASPTMTVVIDEDGSIAAANAAWYRGATEFGDAPMVGDDFRSTLLSRAGTGQSGGGEPPLISALGRVLEGTDSLVEVEVESIDAQGTLRTHSAQVARLSPPARGAVIVLTDITTQRSLERQLAHRANHDPLTGLPNRGLLEEELNRALGRSRRSGRRIGVLFCDLDGFKAINDQRGHDSGDSVLRDVTERIKQVCRSHDLVARFGGDEFVVIAEDSPTVEDLVVLGERIIDTVGRAHPIDGIGESVSISMSIGVSLSDPARHRFSGETLIAEADIAMYAAKEAGGSRVEVFVDSMSAQAQERSEISRELQGAIERGELHLLYQPVVEMGRKGVMAIEALVRWEHPERGLLTPDSFLSAMNHNGTHLALAEWSIETALEAIAGWEPILSETTVVSVNLSARQTIDPGLVPLLRRVLASASVPPQRLALEFPEGVLDEDPELAIATLTRIADLGVTVMMDDFGAARSSLLRLQDVPLGAIKVDRRLVSRIDHQPQAAALLAAAVAFGHALGVRVVAEGIETSSQQELAVKAGCDAAQGFALARPMGRDEVPAWVQDFDWLYPHPG
jgi:diguanylate cyclase (GGDEF)-like protein/PAS domain S-box-containing protein